MTLIAASAPAATAATGWGRPFEFTKPGTLDLIPAQLAFAPSGGAAAAFGIEDVDTPGSSQAYVASRSASGTVTEPRSIGSARQILGLSFDGSALQLLTGTSPSGQTCCSAAQAVRLTAGGALQRPRTLISGLTGAATGRLLTFADGGMLAAVATEGGVWVMQAGNSDRFGGQHRLTSPKQAPESLSAAWLGGESTIVTWTAAAAGPAGSADPRSIYYALGSRSGAPRRVHTLLTVPAGHRVDELAVARRGSSATVAWVESWYDRNGAFHSQIRAADVAAHPGVRNLSPSEPPASGLAFAADPAGDQGIAWNGCRQDGSCTVQVATRGAKASFGASRSLGSIDPSEQPALAVGPRGQAVAVWVRDGHPVAATGAATGGRFGATRVLSSTIYAYDATAAFGSGREALAAWSQGTLNPSVVGAAYSAP